MKKVRTTVTHTDLLEKRRKLDEKIVEKKKEVEQIDKEKELVASEVEDKTRKLKELSEDFETFSDKMSEILAIHNDMSATTLNSTQDALSMVKSSLDLLSFLDGKIEIVRNEIVNLKKKQDEIQDEISREQSALSKNKKDLDIYKERLQKYIDESGAPIKLKL